MNKPFHIKDPIIFFAMLCLLTFHGLAQDSVQYITVRISESYRGLLSESFFTDFETEHSVTVQVVYSNSFYNIQSASYGLDTHFMQTAEYVTSADVLFVDWSIPPIAATRAGYWLDIAPLVQADPLFNQEEFYAPILQSVQWDGGIWALPIGFNLNALNYQRSAFDELGLDYPTANWTLEDLVYSLEQLSTRDRNGIVIRPGGLFLGNEISLLLRLSTMEPEVSSAMLGPDLYNQALVTALDTWAEAAQAGYTGRGFSGTSEGIPIVFGDYSTETSSTFLLGGYSSPSIVGFAVSPATSNPQLAYELARYLALSHELPSILYDQRPARKTAAETSSDLEEILERVVPLGNLAFSEYILTALNLMLSEQLSAQEALLQAQSLAESAWLEAQTTAAAQNLVMATPEPSMALPSGEIRLYFNLNTAPDELDGEAWQQAIDDFVAQDPEVGQIILSYQSSVSEVDCMYYPYAISLEQLQFENMDLAPLVQADPQIDLSRFIGNVLAPFQFQGRLYALPVTIRPQVVYYHIPTWVNAGIPLPDYRWTIDDFNTVMNSLGHDTIIFSQGGITDDTYLLQLMAAFGAIPLDFRTTIPTANWGDPATKSGMEIVLNFARNNLLSYRQLIPSSYTNIAISTPAMYATYYQGGRSVEDYALVPYPAGSSIEPTTYAIGILAISNQTASPEACYRWLSRLIQKPELFDTMPAYQPNLEQNVLATVHGEEALEFYNYFLERIESPHSINFLPSNARTMREYPLHYLLNQVFDRFVLQSSNLEVDLEIASSILSDYETCLSGFPEGDRQAFGTCFLSVNFELAG